MNPEKPTPEFLHFLSLNYLELVEALNQKYGKVSEPYFNKKSNGKLVRNSHITKPGLEVHHVAENQFLSLSTNSNAASAPYKYQLPEELVYANQLEHALLHAKIIVEYDGVKDKNKQVGYGGLFTFLIPLINDFYSGWYPVKKNENAKLLPLRAPEQKQNYLMLIKYLIQNHKDDEKLYTSYNSKFGLWDNAQNIGLYKAFEKLGAKPFDQLTLQENDSRMKANMMVQSQGRIDRMDNKKPHWARWAFLSAPICLGVVVIIVLVLIATGVIA